MVWRMAYLFKRKKNKIEKFEQKEKEEFQDPQDMREDIQSRLLTKKNPTFWMKDSQKSQPCDFL